MPDYDGTSRNGLWAFLKEVDEMVFTTDPAEQPNQLANICRAVRRKLKGRASGVMASVPSEWRQMRAMLVTLYSSQRTREQLESDLTSINQGGLKLDEYYERVRALMIDLIIKYTAEAADNDAANERERTTRETARTAFINGLKGDLYSVVSNQDPDTLETAYLLAKNRQDQVGGDKNFDPQELMAYMKDMIDSKMKKLELNHGRQQNDSNGYYNQRQNQKQNRNANMNRNQRPNNQKYCEFHGPNTSHDSIGCFNLQRDRKRNEDFTNSNANVGNSNNDQSYKNQNQRNKDETSRLENVSY